MKEITLVVNIPSAVYEMACLGCGKPLHVLIIKDCCGYRYQIEERIDFAVYVSTGRRTRVTEELDAHKVFMDDYFSDKTASKADLDKL